MKPRTASLWALTLGLVAIASGSACSSKPLPPDSDAAVGGKGGSPGLGGGIANGDAGHDAGLAGASYVAVENDPDCPTQDEDWSKLDGKACDKRLVLDCYKVWDCKPNDARYVDQTLYCFDDTWTFGEDAGSCDSSSVKLDPTSGCPTTPWFAADGLPCPVEGVDCQSTELEDCSGGPAESIVCWNRRWSWISNDVDCNSPTCFFDVGVSADDYCEDYEEGLTCVGVSLDPCVGPSFLCVNGSWEERSSPAESCGGAGGGGGGAGGVGGAP